MRNIKNKNINGWLLALSILAFVIMGTSIVVDIFFAIDFKVDFDSANTILLTVLSVVFTLWFSYLLVIKQIYANGSTKGYIDKDNGHNYVIAVVDFILLFLFGLAVNILGNSLTVCNITFSVLCCIFIVFCAANIYFKIKHNEVKNIIESSLNNIINEFKGSGNEDNLNDELKKLEDIFDEFLYKGASSTCEQIIRAYCKVVEKYIANVNQNIVDGKDIEEKAITYCIDNLKGLFRFDGSDITNKLNEVLISNIYKLTSLSIKCRNIKIERELVKIVGRILTDMNSVSDSFYDLVFRYDIKLVCESIKNHDEESLKLILNTVKNIYFSAKMQKGVVLGVALSEFFILCILVSLRCSEKDSKCLDYYKILFEELERFTLNDNKFREQEVLEVILTAYISDGYFAKCDKAKEDYFKFLKKIIAKKEIYTNEEFVEFLASSIYYYKEKKFVDEKELLDTQFELARLAFNFMEKAPTYVVPEYIDSIKENLDNIDVNKSYAHNLGQLLHQSIVKNLYSQVIAITRDVKEILSNFKQHHKECEKVWLDVFFDSLHQASLKNDSQMQNLILDYLRSAIIKMDEVRNISKDLAAYIVHELEKICTGRFRDDVNFVCSIIEFLNQLASSDTHLYFVDSNNEVKESIFKSIYFVGVDAVEKDQGLVIKRVSNLIGWKIHESIEDGRSTFANLLIDYALDLYRLCYVNTIDDKTKVFVGTLFVIIGAYCSTKTTCYAYRARIINGLKKNEKYREKYKENILASKSLRESGWEVWDNILGKDPKKAMNDFIKEYDK